MVPRPTLKLTHPCPPQVATLLDCSSTTCIATPFGQSTHVVLPGTSYADTRFHRTTPSWSAHNNHVPQPTQIHQQWQDIGLKERYVGTCDHLSSWTWLTPTGTWAQAGLPPSTQSQAIAQPSRDQATHDNWAAAMNPRSTGPLDLSSSS